MPAFRRFRSPSADADKFYANRILVDLDWEVDVEPVP